MTYPAIKLINEAFFLSSIVGKGFNQPTSDQINEGLVLLNDILSEKSVDTELNPYYSSYTFNTVSGQEQYFVPNLIQPETMTFVLNTVRYTVDYMTRKQYWDTFRANTVSTLPFTYTYEKVLAGANLYFYPLPNDVYPITMWGQFFLTQVANLQQDLSVSYAGFYLSYLKFALAARLCMFYSKTVPPYTATQLASLELQINKQVSGPDIINTKVSTLTQTSAINWAWVNLGDGWIPNTGG